VTDRAGRRSKGGAAGVPCEGHRMLGPVFGRKEEEEAAHRDRVLQMYACSRQADWRETNRRGQTCLNGALGESVKQSQSESARPARSPVFPLVFYALDLSLSLDVPITSKVSQMALPHSRR
jgi:hypothetical protein